MLKRQPIQTWLTGPWRDAKDGVKFSFVGRFAITGGALVASSGEGCDGGCGCGLSYRKKGADEEDLFKAKSGNELEFSNTALPEFGLFKAPEVH